MQSSCTSCVNTNTTQSGPRAARLTEASLLISNRARLPPVGLEYEHVRWPLLTYRTFKLTTPEIFPKGHETPGFDLPKQ